MQIRIESFGEFNGQPVKEIFITNEHDITLSFLTLGARINRFLVGEDNIILGFDNMQTLLDNRELYYGATIGPVSGRIAQGCAYVGEQELLLEKNDGSHHLHGGYSGYDWQIWDFELLDDNTGIKFYLMTGHLSNGYPGNVKVAVTHSLNNDNEWLVTYEAQSDCKTLFDPTNHVYFNLNGQSSQTIKNHYLKVNASYYYPVTEEAIQYDEPESVTSTPFDFRKGRQLGLSIDDLHEQIQMVNGIDHPFIFDDTTPQIELMSPTTKRKIIIETEAPGAVIYTHNKVPKNLNIFAKEVQPYAGIAIEPQILLGNTLKGIDPIILDENQLFKSQTKYSYIEVRSE